MSSPCLDHLTVVHCLSCIVVPSIATAHPKLCPLLGLEPAIPSSFLCVPHLYLNHSLKSGRRKPDTWVRMCSHVHSRDVHVPSHPGRRHRNPFRRDIQTQLALLLFSGLSSAVVSAPEAYISPFPFPSILSFLTSTSASVPCIAFYDTDLGCFRFRTHLMHTLLQAILR